MMTQCAERRAAAESLCDFAKGGYRRRTLGGKMPQPLSRWLTRRARVPLPSRRRTDKVESPFFMRMAR
jgi:hypothetical protein